MEERNGALKKSGRRIVVVETIVIPGVHYQERPFNLKISRSVKTP